MWNNEQEKYLKRLGEQAAGYTWMQEQTAMYYVLVDKILGIIIIILSGVVGTNNFIAEELSIREIIFGTIGYIVAILGMLQQFIKPMEVSQQRISIANKFQDIYYDIQQELVKKRELRMDSHEYLKIITQRFIELYDFSPSLNKYIVRRYKITFNDIGIAMPMSADGIHEIKIYQNDSTVDNMVIHNSHPNTNTGERKVSPSTNTDGDLLRRFMIGRLNNNT